MQVISRVSAEWPRSCLARRGAALLAVGLLGTLVPVAAAVPPGKGQVILAADFESAVPDSASSNGQQYESGWQSPRALCIDSRAGTGGGSPSFRLRLPAEALRGCTLRGSAMVKADVPHQFTHQGVHERDQPPVAYPGQIAGKYWDKEALRAALQPVADFQRTYNVHIYMGEFSAIRWAPGDSACRYLRDVIEIFEEHGWDWSYHAFREWSGWSVEHGRDRNDTAPTAQPTDRQLLLREWFGKNPKPTWTTDH